MVRWRHIIRWGLSVLAALTLAACNVNSTPPTPTLPAPLTGEITLKPTALETLGYLQARAILTFGQNGWVHITETVSHDLDREIFTTLPDGSPVPLNHVLETWANVTGEEHLVTQRVIYLRDGAGNLLQTSVMSQGVAWNSSTGTRESQTETAVGAFDRGFGASVGEYQRVGATVSQTTGTLNGVPTIEILVDYNFDQASKYEDYTEAVAGQTITAVYDPNGGNLLKLIWMMRLADGSQRAYGVWDIALENDVTPPNAVTEALKVLEP